MKTLSRLNTLEESFKQKAARYHEEGDRLNSSFYRRAARAAARIKKEVQDRRSGAAQPVKHLALANAARANRRFLPI